MIASAITDFNHHRFQPLNLAHRICAVDRDETVESNFLKLHILFCERVPKMLNLTIYISSPKFLLTLYFITLSEKLSPMQDLLQPPKELMTDWNTPTDRQTNYFCMPAWSLGPQYECWTNVPVWILQVRNGYEYTLVHRDSSLRL